MVGDKFYPADKQTLDKIYDILVGYDDDVYGFIEHMATLVTAERIEYIGRNKNYTPMTVNLSGDHLGLVILCISLNKADEKYNSVPAITLSLK